MWSLKTRDLIQIYLSYKDNLFLFDWKYLAYITATYLKLLPNLKKYNFKGNWNKVERLAVKKMNFNWKTTVFVFKYSYQWY